MLCELVNKKKESVRKAGNDLCQRLAKLSVSLCRKGSFTFHMHRSVFVLLEESGYIPFEMSTGRHFYARLAIIRNSFLVLVTCLADCGPQVLEVLLPFLMNQGLISTVQVIFLGIE